MTVVVVVVGLFMNSKQRRKKMKEHNDPLTKETSVAESETNEQQDPATIVSHITPPHMIDVFP